MIKNVLLLLLLVTGFTYGQKKDLPYTFGKISEEELTMDRYEKDSTANAVVLYEHGNTTVENIDNDIFLRTTYYKKIKILNDDGKDHATVKIYIYNDKNKTREKVKRLKALTYNKNEPKYFLNSKKVYTKTINDHWKEVTFTFPNVKAGSVLEYQYDLESKFFFNFTGWDFQSDIPKIYSEFHASIPGNWRYNRHLTGSLRLDKNEASIKKNCFSLGRGSTASCEVLTYAMRDIPAFIEEDNYTTSSKNYISAIKFELSEIFYTNGQTKKYTTTWEETDKRLKYDESIGRSANNKAFFSKSLPQELFAIENDVERTKAIYKHIQDHYTLNTKKTYIFSEVNVNKAYKEGIGSVSEINLALINALQAANIKADIMLSSTRSNGFPTKLHPVMTDFNYLIAFVRLYNSIYYLDASDKYLPFNMLPFKALNSYGRILDFDSGSFWYKIEPKIRSTSRKSTKLVMDEDGNLTGNLTKKSTGYFAKFKREEISGKNKQSYPESLSEDSNIEYLTYDNENEKELSKPFIEYFDVEISAADIVGNKIYLIIGEPDTNPFILDQRNYPVDFGFTMSEYDVTEIKIPESYKVIETPQTVKFMMPEKGGSFIAKTTVKDNNIMIFNRISLSKTIYPPEEYKFLKEFFNKIIKFQNSFIILEKKSDN